MNESLLRVSSLEGPEFPGYPCCRAVVEESCVCGNQERALRYLASGAAAAPLTQAQREWCRSQLQSVEGYVPVETWASDSELASHVLRAWADSAGEQGIPLTAAGRQEWPFASSRPRKGQTVTYANRPGDIRSGCVEKVKGDLCHVKYPGRPASLFIWRSKDGLNTLHDWPTKAGGEPDSLTAGEGAV
jgi:hypothetical protein